MASLLDILIFLPDLNETEVKSEVSKPHVKEIEVKKEEPFYRSMNTKGDWTFEKELKLLLSSCKPVKTLDQLFKDVKIDPEEPKQLFNDVKVEPKDDIKDETEYIVTIKTEGGDSDVNANENAEDQKKTNKQIHAQTREEVKEKEELFNKVKEQQVIIKLSKKRHM